MAGCSQNTRRPSWVLWVKRSSWRGAAPGCKIMKSRHDRQRVCSSPTAGRREGAAGSYLVTWQSGKTLQVIAVLGEPWLGDTRVM